MKKILLVPFLFVLYSANSQSCKFWDAENDKYISVSWTGECKNGFAEGYGTASWEKGVATGKSINGKLNDYARVEYLACYTLEGNFTNGELNGQGIKTDASGNIITGNWTNGNAEGSSFIMYYKAQDNYYVFSNVIDGKPEGKAYMKKDGEITNLFFRGGVCDDYSVKTENEATVSNEILGYAIGGLIVAGGIYAVVNYIRETGASYGNYSSAPSNSNMTNCYEIISSNYPITVCGFDLAGYKIHCTEKDRDLIVIYYPTTTSGDCIFRRNEGWYSHGCDITDSQWSLLTYEKSFEEAANEACDCE
jgi:hypothetical protein